MFDVIVVGGGIHGACVARDAAMRGYHVLLLEARDYASGTSSRSSKMLHGGIRYLETGNLLLVRAALQERERWLSIAPHLTCSRQFLFPVVSSTCRPAWQIRAGLALYDMLAITHRSGRFPSHTVLSPDASEWRDLRALGLQFNALFSYNDGQMNDARLVIESVVDSSERGAITLNYAAVKRILTSKPPWQVEVEDSLTGDYLICSGRYIVNACGPWLFALSSGEQARFSRGSHLLFDRPWPRPGVILTTERRGRYYFVLPLFLPGAAVTLVGTTDVEIASPEEEREAPAEDIDELLGYLRRDLPGSGLDRSSLYGTYSGVRILQCSKAREISTVSRSHKFLRRDGYLGILGGKLTTARSTAEDAVDSIDRYFRRRISHEVRQQLRTAPLPGGVRPVAEVRAEFGRILAADLPSGGSNEIVHTGAVERFGSRVLSFSRPLSFLQGTAVLKNEVEYVFQAEQAETAEDVLSRRLCTGLLPEDPNIRRAVEAIAASLKYK